MRVCNFMGLSVYDCTCKLLLGFPQAKQLQRSHTHVTRLVYLAHHNMHIQNSIWNDCLILHSIKVNSNLSWLLSNEASTSRFSIKHYLQQTRTRTMNMTYKNNKLHIIYSYISYSDTRLKVSIMHRTLATILKYKC